jgi:hypothetical protein
MGSSSGAKGSKSINISINKGRSMGGNSSDSDSDSGNTTARTAAHGVSLRIGGGCSCTKDCQPATRKVSFALLFMQYHESCKGRGMEEGLQTEVYSK